VALDLNRTSPIMPAQAGRCVIPGDADGLFDLAVNYQK